MSQAAVGSADILAEGNTDKREEVIDLLKKAYWMEIETVMSYIANSVNPDGVRAQEIKESLEQDIQEELGHAQQYAQRIKELYGVVPGSEEFDAEQSYLQPPSRHAGSRPPSGTRSTRHAPRGRRSAARWMRSASSGSPRGSRRGRPASIPEGYARPSFSYSRRKPSKRRRWPCSSWRIAVTMSCVTGSMPSVNSMIRE